MGTLNIENELITPPYLPYMATIGDLFHRSGVAYSNTMKISFFWRFTNATVVEDERGALRRMS